MNALGVHADDQCVVGDDIDYREAPIGKGILQRTNVRAVGLDQDHPSALHGRGVVQVLGAEWNHVHCRVK